MLIDKNKLPLNIGDRVSINNTDKGTIIGYYFSDGFNNYASSYGYTISMDNYHEGHRGQSFSYDENGEKIKIYIIHHVGIIRYLLIILN